MLKEKKLKTVTPESVIDRFDSSSDHIDRPHCGVYKRWEKKLNQELAVYGVKKNRKYTCE